MADIDGAEQAAKMTLLRIEQSYWLYEGDEYLNEMLYGAGGYPIPVRMITFRDAFALRLFLKDRAVTDFWGINPDIVERLRRNDELIDVEPPLG